MLTIILLILYFSGCLDDLAVRDNKEITILTKKEILLSIICVFIMDFLITITNLTIIDLIF